MVRFHVHAQKMITSFIIILALASYAFGIYAIIKKTYKPNLFSRVVWLALGVNSLFTVIQLQNNKATLAIAWVAAFGSFLIFLGSLFSKGNRIFARNEIIASVLLVISLIIWLVADVPIINLSIGLIAHFVGSLPTLIRVIHKPSEENVLFWLFFALASLLAFIVTPKDSLKEYMYVLYYVIFDGGMTLLSLRQYSKKA